MALALGRYGSREIMDTQIIDYATQKPIMYMDYALSAATESNSEVVYATGGSGAPRRISWFGSKEMSLTLETQIFTMQHLSLLAGENLTSGASNIFKREVLVVESDGASGKQVTLSKTPVGGAEGVSVFAFVNGIMGAAQEVDKLASKVLTLKSTATVEIGDEVEVYYQFSAASSQKLSFTAKGFPKYVKIVGDTVYADEVAGEMVPAQLTYYKARLQPNFTLSTSPTGDPATLSLTFDVFPVKVDGTDTLMDMVLYEDE